MTSIDPRPFHHDGRNLDPERADLSGEAITLQIDPDRPMSVAEMVIVKSPRWKWQVPAYLAVGGAAGSAATLGAAVGLIGGPGTETFVRSARWVSGIGTAIGAGLLVSDLGRPERFLHMLRVFRPTSPMNVGSWILMIQSGSTWVAIAADVVEFPGSTVVRRTATAISGLFGMPLAGYTGVLFGATTNPAWNESRRHLPALFVASAMSAGGGALTLAPGRRRDRRAAELFGIVGRGADLIVGESLRRHLDQFPATSAAASDGLAGRCDRASKAATGAGLVMGALGLVSPTARRVGALCGLAGSLLQRFAVFEAGKAAALDPQCVIETQT